MASRRTDAAVETHGLTKRYGTTTALDSLDLEVRRGEVFGYLGPNGAGKTTTIRLLLGLLRATAGTATVLGYDAWRQRVEAHRRLAYVPGEFVVWPRLTGAETLELLGRLHGGYDPKRRDALCERFELDPSKKARTYSRGNRQKIGLVAAFMVDAELLIMDEPTSGLDPLMENVFRDCVREAAGDGRTVLLSSHILSEVEAVCDRVGILRAGRLIQAATLHELRGLSRLEITIRFAGPVPDLTVVPGLEQVEVEGNVVRCRLQGSPDALIKELSRHQVIAFESREPSLEELFLGYYGA